MKKLEWTTPEWFDPKDGQYEEAHAAYDEAGLTESSVTLDRHGWFFSVNATSLLSEYPEVQTAGDCGSLEEGQAKCEQVVAEILRKKESAR